MGYVNPKNYDLEELRSIGGPSERAPRDMAPGEPYLESLPSDGKGRVLSFRWSEYLVAKMGRRGVAGALRMYRELDWISGEVARQVSRMVDLVASSGKDEAFREIDEMFPDHEDGLDAPFYNHYVSLIFISKLAGDDIREMKSLALPLDVRSDVRILDGFDEPT